VLNVFHNLSCRSIAPDPTDLRQIGSDWGLPANSQISLLVTWTDRVNKRESCDLRINAHRVRDEQIGKVRD
jgi:hypothetical protein